MLAGLGVGWSLLLSAPAYAANPYNGRWDISFEGVKNVEMGGTVVVKDEGGTWKVHAENKQNPCVGRESPIVVKTATGSELVFDVERSKGLASCKDWTVKLKRVDDNTLKGQFADGREITLERE